jgi:tetratricopeptide (TPR) repeat protein
LYSAFTFNSFEGNQQGNACATLGNARKAIEYHEQALTNAHEIGDRRGEALDSWNLGLAYEKAGDLERATELMQLCVGFEREIGHPEAGKDEDYLRTVRAKSSGRRLGPDLSS